MAYFSEEKIDELLEAVDLVDLVGGYVSLKRAGSLYKGLCPFHNEKTPSFTVTPAKRIFHCFGCGAGGHAIRFLMMIAGLSFPEAVAELAGRYGVELPEEPGRQAPAEAGAVSKPALYEVLKEAGEFFSRNLWGGAGARARDYLAGRGLTGATARDFQLGLAFDDWSALGDHLTAKGFGEKALLAAGLVKPRREGGVYDTFRHRLMAPITDAEGRVTAFGGRLLGPEAEGQPKYLNSPETAVYKKGRLLYGYKRARPFLRASGLIFLVEGYFDLIAMVQAGIGEVAATLGTALTQAHLNLLRGQVTEVMLLFDADEAGQRAAGRALPLLLNAELDGRVLRLPQGHDPDTFVREFGAEALYEAAGQAMDVVEFYVGRLKAAHPDSLAGQARMAREARELLTQVPDSAKSQLLRRRLARFLEIDEEALGAAGAPPAPGRALSRGEPPAAAEFDGLAAELLKFMITHPESAALILEEAAAFWPDDLSRRVFSQLREQWERHGDLRPERLTFDDSGAMSALIAGALSAERLFKPAETGEVARAYVGRLAARFRKRRQGELSAAIRSAQARGDQEGLSALLAEKKALLEK